MSYILHSPVVKYFTVQQHHKGQLPMKELNRKTINASRYPTKIMQFGEGNFLRAFVDWQIDHLNKETNLNAGISIIRPIDYDQLPLLNIQDGLYTCIIRGIDEAGKSVEQIRIIESVNEEIPIYKAFDQYMALAENPDLQFIFSNTTEAGIQYIETDLLNDKPAKAFPAKLTQWLHHRYITFSGSKGSGLVIIPCELIDYNGEKLKEIVLQYCQLWELEQGFIDWLNTDNHFCSTLVDRIVTGYPRDEIQELEHKLGYKDNFIVTSEYFHLFVIQGPAKLAEMLHLEKSELNIKVVDDIYPYKQRKVAILNGAHTAMVPLALLGGLEAVGQTMQDGLYAKYVDSLIFNEIIPTLDLPKDELQQFANDVIKRFQNPYIHHLLISIALNSMTKVHTRLIPQLLKYVEQNKAIPPLMSSAIAAQILLYKGEFNGQTFALSDSDEWMTLFKNAWNKYDNNEVTINDVVKEVLCATWHWEQDLSLIPGLQQSVSECIEQFIAQGVRATLQQQLAE